MKLSTCILFVILFIIASHMFSQSTNEVSISQSTTNAKYWRLEILETYGDKLKKNEPAKFNVIFSQSDSLESSFAIDAAVGLVFDKWDNLEFKLFSEIHRNSQIKKKQNVRQIGVNLTYELPLTWGSNGTPDFFVAINLSGKHSKDFNAESGSSETGIFTLHFSPFWDLQESWLSILSPYNTKIRNHAVQEYFQFEYRTSLGIEHITQYDLSLFYLSGQIIIYPFSGLLKKAYGEHDILNFKLGYALREPISENTQNIDVGRLFTWGIGVKFKIGGDENSIQFGYDFSNGPNPIVSLKDQKFGQLSAKAFLKL